MRRLQRQQITGEDLFVGIDLHKVRWHVTIQTADVELFCSSIPGEWEALERLVPNLDRSWKDLYQRTRI